MKPLRLYWWNQSTNFGDLLSPVIVHKMCNRQIIHSWPSKCELAAVGSIGTHLFLNYSGYIWGSGIIRSWEKTQPLLKARHCLYRGKISRKILCGENSNVPLGDPALLVSKFSDPVKKPELDIGIIPHMSEINHGLLHKFLKLGCTIINPLDTVNRVIETLKRCSVILSSSLHGLIVADSFDIPNTHIVFDHPPDNSDKYEDYYSAFSLHDEPVKAADINSVQSIYDYCSNWTDKDIETVQDRIIKSFPKELGVPHE